MAIRDNRLMFRPNGEFEPVQPAEPLLTVFEQPPPRRLPPVVEARVRRKGRGQMLISLLIGSIFLLVGVMLSLVFFPWRIADSLALQSERAAVASGTVTLVENTGYKVNSQRVREFHYTFTVGGEVKAGRCYYRGGNYAPGCPIKVRYLSDRPEINCAVGGTLDPTGNGGAFVAIFPTVGLFITGFGLVTGFTSLRLQRRLAREGFMAEGRVTMVERTSVRVNNRYRYRIAVEYDALGPQRMTYYAYGHDVDRAEKMMESNAVVHVLYDRNRPERAVVVEHIIG